MPSSSTYKPALALTDPSAARGFVGEIRRQPPLDIVDRLALAAGVVRDLILPDATHREVARVRVGEIQTAHARGRRHRRTFGQLDAKLARVEQIEQLELLAVIRACGIPERRTNASMTLAEHILRR